MPNYRTNSIPLAALVQVGAKKLIGNLGTASAAPAEIDISAAWSGAPIGVARMWDGGAVMQAGTFDLWTKTPVDLVVSASNPEVILNAGTVTAALYANGTLVTGGTVTASTTVATAGTVSGSPTLAAGSRIQVVLSSPSGNPAGTIQFNGART